MAATTNSAATGIGGGISLTAAQVSAGATGVIASDSSGNAYKQDGTAFTGGGGTIPSTSNVLKGNGSGGVLAATPGTDYVTGAGLTAAVAPLPSVLLQSGVLLGIAPSACAVSVNGATLTWSVASALLDTYSNGIWLYFVAGSIDAAQVAGFYWVVMSSLTTGQIFQNTYTPGSTPFTPPVSPTPYTTNSGNASTTGTTSTVLAYSATVPANSMGANGAVRYRASLRNNNSAGAKTIFPYWGGATGSNPITAVTTAVNSAAQVTIFNAGATSRQSYYIDINTSSSGAFTDFAVNTTSSTTAGFAVKLGAATDWLVVRFASLEIAPAS